MKKHDGIKLQCPFCQKVLHLEKLDPEDWHMGRGVKCNTCGNVSEMVPGDPDWILSPVDTLFNDGVIPGGG